MKSHYITYMYLHILCVGLQYAILHIKFGIEMLKDKNLMIVWIYIGITEISFNL